MKRIAIATLAVCLLGGTAALAEPDHDHNNDGGHNNGGHNNGGQPRNNPQVVQHQFQGGPQIVPHNNPQVLQHQFQGAPQNAPQVYERHFQGTPQNGVQVYERHFQGAPQNGPQVFQHEFQGPQNVQRNNNAQVFEQRDRGGRGFRGDRPQYNPQFFPRVFHPRERFEWREGHWRHPNGWFYRTWFYGQILPWGWYDQDYWISDYWFYDLPIPPYGYEWVRNGPDALLVDIRSGFVVEVVPGIFY